MDENEWYLEILERRGFVIGAGFGANGFPP
jgi:hypothetical protein